MPFLTSVLLVSGRVIKWKGGPHPNSGALCGSSAQATGCNPQFFRQWEWPRLLQGRARRGERPACVGVKCHKVCERNLPNHKADTPTAPPAPIIHTIARAMYVWLFCLPIPKVSGFESTREHQPLEIPSASCPSANRSQRAAFANAHSLLS